VAAEAVPPTDLLGEWHLARRIVDRGSPGGAAQFGRVSGTLSLAAAGPDEVVWDERGVLTWAGRQLPVCRVLRVLRSVGRWTVCFEDGREFHPWRPGVAVVHPCRADTYRGVVDVAADHRLLRVLWDVTGPAKDARLFTRCVRRPT
jgi:hypothetical protein